MGKQTVCLVAMNAVVAIRALGAQDTLPHRLPTVVITRDVGRSALELPFAISTVRPDSLTPGLTHLLVEQTLSFVPGLTVANRNNPSQDARVSIRGFGARSAFGVRSLRVLRDGMPLTLPDGQTPIDYLDLEGVGEVETLRGTASALYGNASGGVIDLRSAPPPSTPLDIQIRGWTGTTPRQGWDTPDALQRYVAMFGGTLAEGRATYLGNIGRTRNAGAREHAKQELTNAFVRATSDVRGVELSLVGLGLDMPIAENPGALTRIQFDTNPDMADPLSVTRRARKEVHQVQVGVSGRKPLDHGELVAQIYGGGRSLYNPLTFAIVGIDRATGGASLRATTPVGGGVAGARHRLTFGADAQRLSDARKNWTNCNGAAPSANCAVPGIEQGARTLDQREIVTSVGPYIRDEVPIGRVLATAGLRADRTKFEVRDNFLTDGRDDSGTRTMSAVSPMVGLALPFDGRHTWYVNVSSAFETPTTTELGNKPDSTAGLNPDLKPQYSWTYESGIKGNTERLRYDLALYSTRVRDELIPFDIGNGRTSFRNAGRTSRRGVEVALGTHVGPLDLASTYTYSHFRFRDFLSGTTQYAGNVIPGIPEHQGQVSATWRARRGFAVAEWLAKSKVYVNDANAAAAPGYASTNVRVGGTAAFGRPWLTPVVGVQNAFDRKYVGSVAVNAAGTVTSAKFYEPGSGRTWFAGFSAATAPW